VERNGADGNRECTWPAVEKKVLAEAFGPLYLQHGRDRRLAPWVHRVGAEVTLFDYFGVTALLLLAASGTWLGRRAKHAERPAIKWVGLVLSSVVALACTAALVAVIVGYYRINYPANRQAAADIRISGTPDQIARGARFGALCAGCHSADGNAPLVGRNFLPDGPSFGTLWAPNLTPAGELANWSDGEVIRAIREGVHKSGRSLVVMPSPVFHQLGDDDVEAIVAYLRSQPATQPSTPPTSLNVLAAFLIGSGLAPTSVQPHITQRVLAPPEEISVERGKYLISIATCSRCHGEQLTGGEGGDPDAPAGPNLRAILTKWEVEDFIRTIRTGVDPYNHTLAEGMPWKEISAFASDTDLGAMYMYLHGLPLMTATTD